MLRFAAVWQKHLEHSAANLLCIPYEQFDSQMYDFYTIIEIPDPDTDDYE